ncbi:MAG: hypothetical protein HQ472_01125 [Ignavibacteria bacterium]|nr:hypothetical protein [Ignavibacteria bacterium]
MVRSLAFYLVVVCVLFSPLQSQSWKLLIPVRAVTMQVNPKDANKLYIGHENNQMYRSNDAGKTWDRLVLGSLFTFNSVTSLTISATDTAVILAGGYAFYGIKRSTNGGEDWSQALKDPNDLQMWYVSDAIVRHPSIGDVFYAARFTFPVNIYKSVDNGVTWDSISNISGTVSSRICTISIRPDSTNILFLGVLGGRILRSDDSGHTWATVPVLRGKHSINEGSEIPKIIFDHKNPQIGYAIVAINTESSIADNGGILKTVDGGRSWDRIAASDTSFWAIDMWRRADGSNEIFAGGFRTSNLDPIVKGDSLIYRSTDDGQTWRRILGTPWQENSTGDTIRNIWMFRADSVGHKMYMATEVGLYVFEDITGVDDGATEGTGLYASYASGEVTITDMMPDANDAYWRLYTMNAQKISEGKISYGQPVHVNTGQLASGAYLLVWGSDSHFRTISVYVQR